MAIERIERIERRICDRCGVTVDVSHLDAFGSRPWTQVTSQAFGLHFSGAGGVTLDICHACRDALVAWLRDGGRA